MVATYGLQQQRTAPVRHFLISTTLFHQNIFIMQHISSSYAGTITTALRWVTGWTYFSAFWRRMVLENKLNPEEAGYIGEKFNHFLPNALGIKPVIEYLVSHPESLWWAMLFFTLIEGIVGLFFMLGLFTRVMSLAVSGLALGILLGSGWLGTTCLDEWQIGVLGITAGWTIFLSGGGQYALDHFIAVRRKKSRQHKWLQMAASGPLPATAVRLHRVAGVAAVLLLALTLFTNQYFHGGVYGKLHNMSVRPHITISDAMIRGDSLSFKVFRDEGADVYGSFLIGIEVMDNQGNIVFSQNQQQLSQLPENTIHNDYVARVKPGKHSLILPLGARARLTFRNTVFTGMSGNHTLLLTDISGQTWNQSISLNP